MTATRDTRYHRQNRDAALCLALVAVCTGCGRDTSAGALDKRSFGQRQVEQMLNDRPEMRNVVPPSHAVFRWVVSGFDGERLGQRIYWNAASPVSGGNAEHGPPCNGYPPYIAILGGHETTATDKWASLVFEMYNLENNDRFQIIYESALSGALDAEGYAEQCMELEFAALVKTREFLQANPLAKDKHSRDTWYNWVTSDFGTFERYKNAHNGSEGIDLENNFRYFERHFESWISPYAAQAARGDR